ncbi:MDR family NADP-dependent oxidoreductase [Nocardia macrotermitis]|uniref:NADPH-dependent curcumin reductase n=1 Tax=Nocardia macrotermitis TaxID=2585198 RepID=A0A7K0DHR0_9NOCA|nr:NADP-dependent oxidoreductase [Nocardia macrotermitis]MQY24334.1 NADPH-dependent curcumin reductase [Nocardia macrotermitis]
MNTRQWRMKHRSEVLTPDDFDIAELTLPPLGDGEVLAKVSMFALDPYLSRAMQSWNGETPGWADGTIHGRLLAEVVESKADGLRAGDLIAGLGRWQEFEIFTARSVERVTDLEQPSFALGVLSGSGLAAWAGLHVAALEPGQTLVVSAAAGTVGSVAGQLARARGIQVIGLAGGNAKCRHVVDVLGFDACIDHRAGNLEQQVKAAAPQGVDVLFENVGAPSMDAVLPAMRLRSRVILCGLAAHYNSPDPVTLQHFDALLFQQISVTPLTLRDHVAQFGRARRELLDAIRTTTVTPQETVVDGFDIAPHAYLDMLAGAGVGKRLLRITT